MKTNNNKKQNWREVRLGDLVTIKSGKRLPKGKFLVTQPTGHVYIRITDIYDNRIRNEDLQFITDDIFYRISKYIVHSGDVILSIVGSIGLVAKVSDVVDGANLTENCVKFVHLKELDSDYLYYFLISRKGQTEIARNTVGAVQKKLPIYGIRNIEIFLPPLSEQKKIAEVLGSLDEKIDLLRRQNKTLEEMAQVLYRKYFIEDAQDDWKEVRLQDVFDFEKGTEPGSKEYREEGFENSVRFIRVRDMMDVNASVFVDKDLDLRFCIKEDVIVSFDGTVGKVNFGIEGAYSSGIKKIVAKDDVYDSLGLKYMLFTSEKVQDILKQHASGSVIMHASSSIPYLALRLPDSKTIQVFKDSIEPWFDKILANQQQIQTLENLRDALLPKLMSGEVEVKGGVV